MPIGFAVGEQKAPASWRTPRASRPARRPIPRAGVWSAAARRRFAWAAGLTAPVESASKLAHSTRFASRPPPDSSRQRMECGGLPPLCVSRRAHRAAESASKLAHSTRFASCPPPDSSRQRMECGGLPPLCVSRRAHRAAESASKLAHSKRFAPVQAHDSSRQRLECGGSPPLCVGRRAHRAGRKRQQAGALHTFRAPSAVRPQGGGPVGLCSGFSFG